MKSGSKPRATTSTQGCTKVLCGDVELMFSKYLTRSSRMRTGTNCTRAERMKNQMARTTFPLPNALRSAEATLASVLTNGFFVTYVCFSAADILATFSSYTFFLFALITAVFSISICQKATIVSKAALARSAWDGTPISSISRTFVDPRRRRGER